MNRYLFITYDWLPGRTRLMPWRTIFEVSRNLCSKGHDVMILSINRDASQSNCKLHNELSVPVLVIDRIVQNISELSSCYDGVLHPPDVIFFPITWRSAVKSFKSWPKFSCPVIAYHGAGYYRIVDILRSLRYMRAKELFPFLVDSLIPMRRLVGALYKRKINGVVCMTEFNRRLLIAAGWPEHLIVTIPPGLDVKVGQPEQKHPELHSEIFDGSEYFLFMGNALPIRGFETLVDAAQIVFRKHDSVKLLCLVRSDPGNELALHQPRLSRKLSKPELRGRVVLIQNNVTPDEIRLAVRNSVATVLPFLLVPSEIPLGILETMKEGGTVITTHSGGSSTFVNSSGYLAYPADPKSLAEQMLAALHNAGDNQARGADAKQRMSVHPSWDETADKWSRFAKSCACE